MQPQPLHDPKRAIFNIIFNQTADFMSLAAADKTAVKIVRQGNITKLWKSLGLHAAVLEAEAHALRLGVPQFTEWHYAYNWYNKTMAASLQII